MIDSESLGGFCDWLTDRLTNGRTFVNVESLLRLKNLFWHRTGKEGRGKVGWWCWMVEGWLKDVGRMLKDIGRMLEGCWRIFEGWWKNGDEDEGCWRILEECWKNIEGYLKEVGRMVMRMIMRMKFMKDWGEHCYQDGWKVKWLILAELGVLMTNWRTNGHLWL